MPSRRIRCGVRERRRVLKPTTAIQSIRKRRASQTVDSLHVPIVTSVTHANPRRSTVRRKLVRSCVYSPLVKEPALPGSTVDACPSLTELRDSASDWVAIDFCCGMGGLSLAARQAGCMPVVGIDISSNALETYRRNYPGAATVSTSVTSTAAWRECKAILEAQYKDRRTLLVAGPPCQGFSVAGKRQPRDPRNRVLPAIARAIIYLSPNAAIVENVAGLLSPRHSANLRRFKETLLKAGFAVHIRALDASHFGVPQTRKRMICFIAKAPLNTQLVDHHLSSRHRQPRTVIESLGDLPKPPVYVRGSLVQCALPNHVAMNHSPRVRRKISSIKPGKGPLSYRRLHPHRIARTLISGHRAPPAHYSEPRSITVREAARLQGFPDTFEICGSFASQMQLVTNAVPPPLAQAAIESLLLALE
jgi:DNA (cytosine-5)-methyltransferase 1